LAAHSKLVSTENQLYSDEENSDTEAEGSEYSYSGNSRSHSNSRSRSPFVGNKDVLQEVQEPSGPSRLAAASSSQKEPRRTRERVGTPREVPSGEAV